jgi:hypothetical protein
MNYLYEIICHLAQTLHTNVLIARYYLRLNVCQLSSDLLHILFLF